MTIKRFEDILAWQKARDLNKELSKTFGGLKNFTFKDQILRAGLSICNNIAEGFDRGGDKEFKYFLVVARGSTAEVRSMLYTALDLSYINNTRQQELYLLTTDIGCLITGFIKKL